MSNKSRASKSLTQQALERLFQNRAAVASLIVIVVILLIAIFAPWIAPYSFREQDVTKLFQFPSWAHPFGTDELGRDLLSRVIYGARVSMVVAFGSALFCFVIGSVYGSISGWIGGRVDSYMMRVVDVFIGLPELVLMILVKVIFDSLNIFESEELRAMVGTTMALSVVGWVSMARMVRGQVLQAKQMLYVESSRALGAKSPRILIQHIWPNILGPVVVLLTFQVPANILAESFLSFIGLGLKPPYSSWGVLAASGFDGIEPYPYLVLFPGLAIFITMLAFNLLGDGLRDAIDPKLK
jgi:oligopeptide transport system permease protein